MRKATYPTFINLKELEAEAEEFQFSRNSGELNSALADLIGVHPYDAELALKSVGNAYEITGKISTQMTLPCARCGRDMIQKIEDNFQELIVVLKEQPRAGHSGHTGSHEHGPFCNYTTSSQFDLAEFVREHIAAAEPYAPQCRQLDCEMHYLAAQKSAKGFDAEEPTNPFAVLKNITPKGQRD